MNEYLILTLHVHLNFVVFDERIRERAEWSASARTEQQNSGASVVTHMNASDCPSCVIVYNAQC